MRYLLAILFLLFSSCATKPLKKDTGLTAEDFWQEQALRRESFLLLDGKAKIRLEENGKSISGNGRILMHSRDSIKMEIRDAFGRLHFSALKKKKSFVAYLPNQKQAFSDEEGGAEYLLQKLKVSLPFDSVTDLWLGRLPESWSKSLFKSWHWDGKEGNYVGTLESGSREIECHVDGDLGILKKIVVIKPKPTFEVIYDDFGACCSDIKKASKKDLAYSIKLNVLEGTEKVELEWEELVTGAKLPRIFDIELPKETEKIILNP